MYYVYRFVDKNKNIIYIGKSKQDLEQRFRGHLHLPNECYSLVYKIEYIECSTESDMSIKEIYYINKYKNEHFYFNVLDKTELPTSVEFTDKWKMYKGPLESQFCNSINYKKGYTTEKKVRYNKDGSIDKRKSNSQKGLSTYVEAFTNEEVNRIIQHLIHQINIAENNSQEQIRFRNLVMFVLGVNLPHKPKEFLYLKYQDIFDENNQIKPIKFALNRFHQDEILNIPLRKIAVDILMAYKQKYELNYTANADDYLFESREHRVISLPAWWRILDDSIKAVGMEKNIGAESLRKTYALNIYQHSENQLNALLFLGELWGKARESQLIRYLKLTDEEIDYDYYFGESFSLGDININDIICLKKPTITNQKMKKKANKSSILPPVKFDKKNNSAKEPKQKTKTNRLWTVEMKMEIIEKHLFQKIPQKVLAEEYNVDAGAISRWISTYRQYGKSALEDKRFKTK